MPLNAPNLLTLARIIFVPVVVVFYYLPTPNAHVIVTCVFVAAAITDWLDGYLARKLRQGSPFGAFLDPVADKLIVAAALIILVSDPAVLDVVYSRVLFAVATIVIIGREIAISSLREWMAGIGRRSSVAVNFLGKLKTVLQMTAISMLLFREDLWNLPILKIGEVLLYIASALTVWSMVGYLRAAWPALSESE